MNTVAVSDTEVVHKPHKLFAYEQKSFKPNEAFPNSFWPVYCASAFSDIRPNINVSDGEGIARIYVEGVGFSVHVKANTDQLRDAAALLLSAADFLDSRGGDRL